MIHVSETVITAVLVEGNVEEVEPVVVECHGSEVTFTLDNGTTLIFDSVELSSAIVERLPALKAA
jgi:hypothetical protein